MKYKTKCWINIHIVYPFDMLLQRIEYIKKVVKIWLKL